MSTAPTPTAYIPWPEPSPTSKYRINVRYYHLLSDDAVAVTWDLGPQYEETIESLYELALSHGKAQTPLEFEQFVRSLMENRLQFMTGMAAYPLILSLLTGDQETIVEDVTHQVDMMLRLYNKTAKIAGWPKKSNPLKPTPFWKKLLA